MEQIRTPERAVLAAALAGGLLSVALGAFGFAHDPAIANVPTLGFGTVVRMKVWLAVVVGILACSSSAVRCGCTAGWVARRRPGSGRRTG